MKRRDAELVVVIDVDDTLVKRVYTRQDFNTIDCDYYGMKWMMQPIKSNIEFLKSLKARGYEITVWSANGVDWAEEIVKKLKLENTVDWVATKPSKYVDDKDANSWMTRVYVD